MASSAATWPSNFQVTLSSQPHHFLCWFFAFYLSVVFQPCQRPSAPTIHLSFLQSTFFFKQMNWSAFQLNQSAENSNLFGTTISTESEIRNEPSIVERNFNWITWKSLDYFNEIQRIRRHLYERHKNDGKKNSSHHVEISIKKSWQVLSSKSPQKIH